jgi:hypothetical protein
MERITCLVAWAQDSGDEHNAEQCYKGDAKIFRKWMGF